MNEFLKPVVALEKIVIDDLNCRNSLEVKSSKCHDDTCEKLSVNSTQEKENIISKNIDVLQKLPAKVYEKFNNTDALLKENSNFLDKQMSMDSPLGNSRKKKVSFSKQSSVLYYNEEVATDEISNLELSYVDQSSDSSKENEVLSDATEISDAELCLESNHCLPSDVEVQHPQFISTTEQYLPKQVVITLEKLPLNMLRDLESRNGVLKCSENPVSPLKNFSDDDYSSSDSDKSEDKSVTESTEDISQYDQQLECDTYSSKTGTTDLLLKENKCIFPTLKVSLQRLPDNLLEMLQSCSSAESSEEVIHSESPNSDNIETNFKGEFNSDRLSSSNTCVTETLRISEKVSIDNIPELEHANMKQNIERRLKISNQKKTKQNVIEKKQNETSSKNSLTHDLNEKFSSEHMPGNLNCCDVTLKDSCIQPDIMDANSDVHASVSDCILRSIVSNVAEGKTYLDTEILGNVNSLPEINCDTVYKYPNKLKKTGTDTEKNILNKSCQCYENCAKGLKFADCHKFTEKDISDSHNFSYSLKVPYVHLERLNLVLPEVGGIQHTSNLVGNLMKEAVYPNRQGYTNDNPMLQTLYKSPVPVKDSSHPLADLSGRPSTSWEKIRHKPPQSEKYVGSKTKHKVKHKSSLSFHAKPSGKKLKLKSCIQNKNNNSLIKGTFRETEVNLNSVIDVSDHFPSLRYPDHELSPLQLEENIFGNPSVCSLSTTRIPRSYIPTKSPDYMSDTSDDIPLSHLTGKVLNNPTALCPLSNRKISPTYIPTKEISSLPDNSATEDDLPLSHFAKHNYVKKQFIPASLKKKIKKKSNLLEGNSNPTDYNVVTDFNFSHMSGMNQPGPSSFTFNTNKKSQKTSTPKRNRIKKSRPNNEIILLSCLSDINNPDFLTLCNQVKAGNSSSHKRCKKSCTENQCLSKGILVPHMTEMDYTDTSPLAANIAKKVQVPGCDNNSTSCLKNIRMDHSYYLSVRSEISGNSNKPVSSLKRVKTDHTYDLPCSFCPIKPNKKNAKNNCNNSNSGHSEIPKLKISPKGTSKKKKDGRCKKKKTLDKPDVFLKTYLKKFCSDFDNLGNNKSEDVNSASVAASLAHKKKQSKIEAARKKKENAYKCIISTLHNHLKQTCPVKKSFKRKENHKTNSVTSLCEKSPVAPVVKVEKENDCSTLPLQIYNKEVNAENRHLCKNNSQRNQFEMQCVSNREKQSRNRKGKERSQKSKSSKKKVQKSHFYKYQLGFLSGNRSLRLYNKCLTSERLFLSKYKMKKRQRRKLKEMFNSLKNNALDMVEL